MAQSATRQLIDLLARLQSSAGLLDRARLLREGQQAMAGMTGQQRRSLAVDVASLAAPDLVPRIQSEGDADLSPEQVGAVFDMLRRLDGDQLTTLRDRLTDAEERQRLLEEAQQRAAAPRERDAAEAPDAPSGDAQALPQGTAAAHGHEMAAAAASSDGTQGGDTTVPPADADVPREAPEAAAEALDVAAAPVEAFSQAMPEMRDWEPAGVPAAAFQFGPPSRSGAAPVPRHADDAPAPRSTARHKAEQPADDAPAPRSTAREVGEEPADDAPAPRSTAREVGEQPVDDQPTPRSDASRALATELSGIASSATRLRRFRGVLADVVDLPARDQVAVMRALPDGWVRRRAAESLLAAAFGQTPAETGRAGQHSEAGSDRTSHVAALVETLGRASDRAWVLGTALELGCAPLAAFDRLVGARTAARLRARLPVTAPGHGDHHQNAHPGGSPQRSSSRMSSSETSVAARTSRAGVP